jgi:hypothetical protein
MHSNAEIEVPVDAMASMATQLGAVRDVAESERAQHRATRALQTAADGAEADDPRFDDDLILSSPSPVRTTAPSRRRCSRITRIDSRRGLYAMRVARHVTCAS